jgi:hypothetical protein
MSDGIRQTGLQARQIGLQARSIALQAGLRESDAFGLPKQLTPAKNGLDGLGLGDTRPSPTFWLTSRFVGLASPFVGLASAKKKRVACPTRRLSLRCHIWGRICIAMSPRKVYITKNDTPSWNSGYTAHRVINHMHIAQLLLLI